MRYVVSHYYSREGWELSAQEDPRNPSFNVFEITFQKTGDTLTVTQDEYSEIEVAIDMMDVPDDDQVLLDGDECYADQNEILNNVIRVYKKVDREIT